MPRALSNTGDTQAAEQTVATETSSWDSKRPPTLAGWLTAGLAIAAVLLTASPETLAAHGIGISGVTLTAGLWLLLAGFAGLSAYRNQQWWRRRRKPREEGYSGIDAYEMAKARWSREAQNFQKFRSVLAVFVAFLSPAAVLCLSMQIIAYPAGGMARGLIAAEASLLIVALGSIYLRSPIMNIHEEWIPARLRVQLLRREIWLYRTRVGAYLACANEDTARQMFEQRVGEINSHKSAVALLEMRHTRTSWHSELEEADAAGLDASAAEIQAYLEDRLRYQKKSYFEPAYLKHERHDYAYEGIARLSLVFALILAAVHLFKLLPDRELAESAFGHLVDISALVMPTIGAGCITLRALFENHRLSHSYEDAMHQMDGLEEQFEDLLTRWGQQDADKSKLSRQFQRLALLTELEFTAETRRWWLIVSPEHLKGGP